MLKDNLYRFGHELIKDDNIIITERKE